MASKELIKAKALQARLLKEKQEFGAIMDRQGTRYYIPELLMQAGELEKGKTYFYWYQKEFPDDVGEPNLFIQWILMFYCLGEQEMALQMARRLLHLNIHAIPRLLRHRVNPIDDFWYGSIYADPDYLTDGEVEEMALPPDFIEWLGQEYDKPSMQALISVYIALRQKLNGTRDFNERGHILAEETKLFKEKPIVKTDYVYQLKTTLNEIEPPIWRRILVNANTKLPALHRIIQTSFGWTNSHLHQFFHEDQSYTDPAFNEAVDDNIGINYTFVSIKDLLHIEGQSMTYEYDFGDSWMHTILLEKILPITDELLPSCTDGERRSPPDDCGGFMGYADLLAILADKSHEEYDETKVWVGKGFNPEKCSLLSINKNLQKKNYGVKEY